MRSTQPLCLTNITPCCVMWRHHHLLLAVLNTSVLRLCLTNITHRCLTLLCDVIPFLQLADLKISALRLCFKTTPFVINITSCYVCECRRYLLLLINWKHRSTHRFTFLFVKLILPALFAIVVLCACVTLLLLTVLETLSITNRTYSIVGNQYPPLFDIVCYVPQWLHRDLQLTVLKTSVVTIVLQTSPSVIFFCREWPHYLLLQTDWTRHELLIAWQTHDTTDPDSYWLAMQMMRNVFIIMSMISFI